jgi:hypothetical protein
MTTGEVNPGEPERVSFVVRSMIELCTRPSLQRVQCLLAEYYPGHTWTPVQIAHHYRAQLAERRWQRTLDALGVMKQAKLTRLERCCARIITEGPSGPDAKRLQWARNMHPHVLAEQERREPILKRIKARGNRAKPVQLGLASGEPLAVAAGPSGGSLSGACVPPPPLAVVPPAVQRASTQPTSPDINDYVDVWIPRADPPRFTGTLLERLNAAEAAATEDPPRFTPRVAGIRLERLNLAAATGVTE